MAGRESNVKKNQTQHNQTKQDRAETKQGGNENLPIPIVTVGLTNYH